MTSNMQSEQIDGGPAGRTQREEKCLIEWIVRKMAFVETLSFFVWAVDRSTLDIVSVNYSPINCQINGLMVLSSAALPSRPLCIVSCR